MSKDESAEVDRLLKIISTLSSLETKVESLKENFHNEITSIKTACDKCMDNMQKDLDSFKNKQEKLDDRQEGLEKRIIKGTVERTEWKAEFEKWKWRLGVIAPILTILITTTVIAILQRVLGASF